MKFTNKYGLPQAIVKAVQNDTYDGGGSDFTVTGLLKPPRQSALQIKYKDQIEEDVSDRIWALLGQIGHLALERSAIKNDITEKRYFAKYGQFTLSGQVDSLSLEHERLTDWKFTTAWKFNGKTPDLSEWTAQLNMQLELLRENGRDAKELQICAILRDWSKMEAQRDPNYPQKSVIVVKIEIWPREKTKTFIKDRMALHSFARLSKLPECSKEERWAKDTKWALMVKGRVRANKVFDTKAGAELAMDYVKDSYIEERPGTNTRCENYCSVSRFCSQYNQTKGA